MIGMPSGAVRVFIPGHPFTGRSGFPDFLIPEFPGMKTARFPGNREQPTAGTGPAVCACARLMHAGVIAAAY